MAEQAVGDFGLIGLAVMGQNLILNIADNGFTVVVFNRTVSKVDRFMDNEAKGKSIVGTHSIQEFCSKLKTPRRIMLLVMAGKAVDAFIELSFHLSNRGISSSTAATPISQTLTDAPGTLQGRASGS